ncbi:DUF1643 domain-containing protein [Methylobacterium nodulans]|uniref:DUF1643 domain-containing protein n=1 Tax=Methylobacterium nodulans (strain LMG 21967 / CNCM I-2342 / ORS 2060) TaxID=460265 RepID=B8ISS6_METNO|nr:DUF1643 domain-containing protein [Methylobacterium nodulans]ACL60725.1 protein of unknown function DUF1643 [Methylobacterium nodulans ORS 2060]
MLSAIRGSAAFSACGQHRHRLDRWWSDAPRALVCAANPSRADGIRHDPTVCRLRALLQTRPGLGGYTLVNVEDRIATDPADLRRWLATAEPAELEAARRANLARIRALSEATPLRIVAWGTLVEPDPHRERVVAALSCDGRYDLFAFGLTGEGAPVHPLARGRARVPLGKPLVIWRPREAAPP